MTTPHDATSAIPFTAWALGWLDRIRQRVRPQTRDCYRQSLHHWIGLIGDIPLEHVRRRDIRDGLRLLLAQGRSVNSVKNDLRVIGTCLEDALDDELLRVNPARGAGRHVFPRLPKPDRALTTEQVASLLRAASHDPDAYDFVALLLALGCRIGELLGARWDDFDLDARQFTIARSMSGHRLGPTKSGRVSTVEVPDFAIQLLRSRRFDYADTPWIFPGAASLDRPLTYSGGRRLFDRALHAAGLAGISPHATRHTYCTNLLAFADLTVVQSQATHQDLATTRGYIRKPPHRARHAVNRLAAPLAAMATPPRRRVTGT